MNAYLTGTLALALLAGCGRNGPRVPPSMSFRTGNGYTSGNDTVPPADTLLIGVVMRQDGGC